MPYRYKQYGDTRAHLKHLLSTCNVSEVRVLAAETGRSACRLCGGQGYERSVTPSTIAKVQNTEGDYLMC